MTTFLYLERMKKNGQVDVLDFEELEGYVELSVMAYDEDVEKDTEFD